MIYDYTVKEGQSSCNRELLNLLDCFSEEEQKKVLEYAGELLHQKRMKESQFYRNWTMDTVLPLLKHFAEKRYSILEVQHKESRISVLLKVKGDLSLADSDGLRDWKIAVGLSSGFGIEESDGWLWISLDYAAD